jgi:PTH1 family peptidyl-tRNA hydrolase
MNPADFVLRDYGTAERRELPLQLEHAADSVEMLITDGLEPAQNRYHALL